MEINPSNLAALFIGFDQRFQALYGTAPTIMDKIAMEVPSSTETLTLPWLQLFPAMREWLGDRVLNNFVLQDISVTNKLYELSAEIPRTKIEDDTYGVFMAMNASGIAYGVKQWPDKQLAALIETNPLGYDQVATYSSSHPVDPSGFTSGTQSNIFTATGGLTAANVATLRAQVMNLKGPNGLPLGFVPNLLMVPPALEGPARQIANTGWFPNTFGGISGPAVNPFDGYYTVVVNPYLTDATSWYLCCTANGLMPYLWVRRTAPEYTTVTSPENAIVFMTDKFLIGVRMRGVPAIGPYLMSAKATNA